VSSKTNIEAAFSVDAEWRGHGFATRLMACVQACAAASGGATVVGQCAVRNLRMRRVFEHAGMTVTREEDELLACGQVAASNVAMELARAA
jgi:RimJ/RimL family protein N-acetyltransferase